MLLCDAGNVYIMVPPRNTTAEEGSRVRFECQAGGYPDNVTVQWSVNGVDVNNVLPLTQPVRRVDVLPDGALVIDDVSKDDTGWYRCRPSNRLGTSPEADAFLNVTCESVFRQPLNAYAIQCSRMVCRNNNKELSNFNLALDNITAITFICLYRKNNNE